MCSPIPAATPPRSAALRGLTEQGITDRAARRNYAHGVRAKLAAYRDQGLLAP